MWLTWSPPPSPGNQSLITTTPSAAFDTNSCHITVDFFSLFPHYVAEPRRGIQQQIITKYFITTDGCGLVRILVAKWKERKGKCTEDGFERPHKAVTPRPTWCRVKWSEFSRLRTGALFSEPPSSLVAGDQQKSDLGFIHEQCEESEAIYGLPQAWNWYSSGHNSYKIPNEPLISL